MQIKKIRFSVLSRYFGIIFAFPIFTTLIDGTIINKFLFVVIFALHVLSLFVAPVKKKTVLLLFFFVLHYVIAVSATDFPLTNVNLLFYFPYFLMYTYFICDNSDKVKQWVIKHEKLIITTVQIWTVLVGVSIFNPNCYYIKEGGSLYFGSWCNDIFRLGPSAIFIQSLVICLQVLRKDKFFLHYTIVPIYSVFMGSSRTYFFIGLCLFVISWYIFCDSKRKFWLSALPLAAIFFVALYNSSMWDKIIYSLDSEGFGGFWFRFTSSRSELWAKDLAAWNEMPLINRLFGCGIDFTLDVSGKWGHNDYVELICSFGIVGLVHYLYATFVLCHTTFQNIRLPFYIKVCVVLIWFFNAFFNMHYVYFCAMLCYPILLVALELYQPEENQNFIKIRFV